MGLRFERSRPGGTVVDVVCILGAGVLSATLFAAARQFHRARLARRQLQELLDAVAGRDARIVITGADSGIGKELAAQLAQHPSVSLLLGNRVEKSFATHRTRVMPLELLDLGSVQAFAHEAHEFLASGAAGLRLLINNAGVKNPLGGPTKFGASQTWQTNFLGPFLLTEIVARKRESAQENRVLQALRVVQVASGREHESSLDQALLEAAGRGEPGENQYADSKRALLLWTSVRAQSLAFKGNLFVHAVNPGKVDTRLGLYWVPTALWLLSKPYRMLRFRTSAEGALAVAAAGLHRQAIGKFGHYSSGEKMLEDLVVWRMPEKKLSVQLVKWASQATALEARFGGRPLSETGRPLSLTDLTSAAPTEEDIWSSKERRMRADTMKQTP